MRLTLPAWIGAVAAVVLALGALLAVYHARRSVREQSRILGTLRQEAEAHAQLLRLQSSQLEAQRGQFREQRRVNERHSELLELQTAELRAALDQRARDAERERQAQASRVTAWIGAADESGTARGAVIRNDSGLPVRSVQVSLRAAGDAAAWPPADGEPTVIRLILPGATAFVPAPAEIAAGDSDDRAAEIEFTDAAGIRWRRDADGALAEC